MDENKSRLYIVAIVGVVALVAMVIMVIGSVNKKQYVPFENSDTYLNSEDATGQMYAPFIACYTYYTTKYGETPKNAQYKCSEYL